jgi:hypothetical protein
MATLSIDTVKMNELKTGDEITVPVRLKKSSDGLLLGFQIFISFNHSTLKWNGTNENPQTGVTNFDKSMLYSSSDWVFNDNGNQFVALWNDPKLFGVSVNDNIVLFEIKFIYTGVENEKDILPLTWGTTFETKDNIVVKGPTEMYSEKADYYELKLIDGAIIVEN